MAILNHIWTDLGEAIQAKPFEDGFYTIMVGSGPRLSRNLVKLHPDGLERVTETGDGRGKFIPRGDFEAYAEEVILNPDHWICIASRKNGKRGIEDCKIVAKKCTTSYTGSVICSCLGLLPYFKYGPDQNFFFLEVEV